VVRLVHAAQPQKPVVIMPEHHSGNQIAQASNGDKETNDDAQEQTEDQQESAKLQALAKITPQQAQQSAESAQGGQASSVKLENEDGNLVYAVVIGHKEVKVDAGNGRVLYTEARNHEDKKTEASHPRSSIQVTEAPGGDGDGETNDDG
ncbi:MAG: PepSY domain-containing protein, partial [Microcystaceae cyanobacterium]